MTRVATSARRAVLATVIFSALLFGSAAAVDTAAAGAAVPPPRDALRQALRDAHALAPQASASAEPASAAVAALAQATAPALWINGREADAPPYGRNVFSSSAAAITDLDRLPGPPLPGGTTAVESILAGDRGLAADAIAAAHGGPAALLATARKAISTGDRLGACGQAAGGGRFVREGMAVGRRRPGPASGERGHQCLLEHTRGGGRAGARRHALRAGRAGDRAGIAAARGRRQAGDLLRRLRGVSVLRRPALGHDRRAVAVRNVLEPAPDAERRRHAPAGQDVHVLRIRDTRARTSRSFRSRFGATSPRTPALFACSRSPNPSPHCCTGSTPRSRRRSSTSPIASSRTARRSIHSSSPTSRGRSSPER